MSAAEPTTGWIAPAASAERVQLDATSWVDVVRGMLPRDTADALHDELVATVRWSQGRVFRYERWIDMPRLDGHQSGAQRHPALVEVEHWISRRYGARFDGVALAHYRNERDGVGFHRDRELRWLEDTVVGVLTLGHRRPWLMKPVTGIRRGTEEDREGALDLSPASGDLIVMGGRCQADWLHAVPQLRHRVRSRVSAQWRYTSRRGERDRNPSFYAPRFFSR